MCALGVCLDSMVSGGWYSPKTKIASSQSYSDFMIQKTCYVAFISSYSAFEVRNVISKTGVIYAMLARSLRFLIILCAPLTN